MARSILSEFGPDAHKVQEPRITKNGPAATRDVQGYATPQGPKHIMNTGVGLRGGTNFSACGSQGEASLNPQTSGSPGIGGERYSDGYDSDDNGAEDD